MTLLVLLQAVERPISVWGVVVPAFVLITSFIVTWMLYRHFSKPHEK